MSLFVAHAARSRAKSAALTSSTPSPSVAEWLSYAALAAVLVCVWALTGAGAFWPAWPLGFWGAALAVKRVRPA